MRWGITGTPGTGKTSAAKRLDRPVVHLNEVIATNEFHTGEDAERESMIADLDALGDWIREQSHDVIVESHVAHLLPVDRVVVLRCHPDELRRRLRQRTEHPVSESSVDENAESEALDVILAEAVERHGKEHLFEIDTTDLSAGEVARAIEHAIDGEMEPTVGSVSFLEDQ